MVSVGLETRLRAHARLVDGAIERFLPSAGPDMPATVAEPVRHMVLAGGKRIRPALCLLAHEAAGGDPADALPTAAGIELLHTFTLVHDDIMDEATQRRSHPTVGALWGDGVAITAGDALFALAFQAFAANAHVASVGPARALAVVDRASRVCVDLAKGQTLDILNASRGDVSITEQLETIRLKTGALLEFSLASGAMLAGASEAEVRALSRFGAPLGIAFQIRDDLLDLVGNAARLGKPTGNDVRMGKRTLMVAHAFQHSPRSARLREILDAPPAKTGPAEVSEAIAIMEDAGSLAFAQATAEACLAEAKDALSRLPGRAADLAALATLADYAVERSE